MMQLRQTQSLKLQQKLAPQLIQSLRLLQLPTLELELLIRKELEINPLLELDEEADLDQEETQPEDENEVAPEAKEALEELEFDKPDLDHQDQYDEADWNHYLNEAGYSSPREEFDPNVEEWHNDGMSQVSLEDSLLEQILLTDLSKDDRHIAQFIIGNIEGDGFLKVSIVELADILGVLCEDVERVLLVIQCLDPLGVGARDLREYLLIQLCELGQEKDLVTDVVRGYWDDLINRRYNKIMRGLGIGNNALRDVEEIISTLNPKPFIEPAQMLNHNLVIPDMEVQKVGEEFVVSLTDRTVPALRVSPVYRTLLLQSKKNGQEAKKFVVEKLNAARWFIGAIHQRRTTMQKVMMCIVQSQFDFFTRGLGNLKPMVLQEVADKVGMHVSTISRVSNGKYVQTPHGIFELKYFFDNGLSRDEGRDDISTRSVREKLAKMIGEEDSHSPLSDQKISEMLKKEGIDIARRTVAKYREQLHINSARYRKLL